MKFGLKEDIINDIIEILKRYEQVDKACIFGSRARGDYRNNSDIDIAIYGNQISSNINNKIYYDIDNLLLPYKIDLISFDTLKIRR